MAKPFKKQKSLNFKLYLENTAPNSFRSKGKKKCYICATLDAINIPLRDSLGDGVCVAPNNEERIHVPIIHKL